MSDRVEHVRTAVKSLASGRINERDWTTRRINERDWATRRINERDWTTRRINERDWTRRGPGRGQRVHRLAVVIIDCFETLFGDLKVTFAAGSSARSR